MFQAGAPGQACPGTESCGWLQEGPDPCAGCTLRRGGAPQERNARVEYALLLCTYVETFRPDPRRLSWQDLDLYQAALAARAEFESEQIRKFWKK